MNTRFTAVCTAALLAGVATQPVAFAGDREWATAGKVLTGIAAVNLLGRALDPAPRVVYQNPAPVVYHTAPVQYVASAPVAPVAPVYAAPVYHYHRPAPVCAPAAPVVYAAPAPVTYVMPTPVYYPSPVVVHPFGHAFRPRRCHGRW